MRRRVPSLPVLALFLLLSAVPSTAQDPTASREGELTQEEDLVARGASELGGTREPEENRRGTLEARLLLWASLTALAACVSAVVAGIYTYFTYRLVRVQMDPHVILYTRHDIDRPSIIEIVVENIGRQIASDVVFSPERPLPARAFGISDEQKPNETPPPVMREGPLLEGIPALGPGDTREITWGQYGGLAKALDGSVRVDFTYRCGRRKFKGSTVLEVRSYLGTDASKKPMVRIARSLEAIEATLKARLKKVRDD